MTENFGIDVPAQLAGTNDIYCPEDICSISKASIICGFVSLLPSGPLWDRQKQNAVIKNSEKSSGCIADYAVFAGNILYELITENLWTALRESNPYTAVTTLDEWLDRLGWQDCYESCHRRKLSNGLSPFEVMGYCGPLFCPPKYDMDYERALKSAIVKALYRLRMGVIPNVASINKILEPLGVILTGTEKLILRPNTTSLTVPQIHCSRTPRLISAFYDNGCDCDRVAGLPRYAWPTVMAAECLVRSIIWSKNLKLETQFCLDPKGV